MDIQIKPIVTEKATAYAGKAELLYICCVSRRQQVQFEDVVETTMCGVGK